jgi:hypothetical protein
MADDAPDPAQERELDRARRLPFLDAVLSMVQYNSKLGPRPDRQPIDIPAQFPGRDAREIESAIRQAHALLGEAFECGVAILGKHKDHATQIQDLRDRHPGFSDETYAQTIFFGYLAR